MKRYLGKLWVIALPLFTLLAAAYAEAQSMERVCYIGADGRRHCEIRPVGGGGTHPHDPPPIIHPPVIVEPQDPVVGVGIGLGIGQQALNIARDSVLVTIIGIEQDGDFVIRFEEGTLTGKVGGNWKRSDLASLRGCGREFCAGDFAFNVVRDSTQVRIVGIQEDGRYVLQFLEGNLNGRKGANWSETDLASTYGCTYNQLCTGEEVFNVVRDSTRARVVGLQSNGKLVIEFLEGSLTGRRGGNWESKDLARTRGCGNGFCVGEEALNSAKNYTRVRIEGIQEDGRFVLLFLEGNLSGRRGGNWEGRDLVRTGNHWP